MHYGQGDRKNPTGKTREVDPNSANAHESGMVPLSEPMVEEQFGDPSGGPSTRTAAL